MSSRRSKIAAVALGVAALAALWWWLGRDAAQEPRSTAGSFEGGDARRGGAGGGDARRALSEDGGVAAAPATTTHDALIDAIELDRDTICSGETVRVTVTPRDDAGDVLIAVGRSQGSPAVVQLQGSGERELVVRAVSREHVVDLRTVTVHVQECQEDFVGWVDVTSRPRPGDQAFRFFVRPRPRDARLASAAWTYRWTFGDDSDEVETTLPFADHAYAPDDSRVLSSWIIEVTATEPGGTTLEGAVSVSAVSAFAESLARFGTLAPRTRVAEVERGDGAYATTLSITNPGEEAIAFEDADLEMVPCETGGEPTAPLVMRASELLDATEVPAGGQADLRLRLDEDQVPEGTCRVVVSMHGRGGAGSPAVVVAGLTLEQRVTRRLGRTAGDAQLRREIQAAFRILGRDPASETVTERELDDLRARGLLPAPRPPPDPEARGPH